MVIVLQYIKIVSHYIVHLKQCCMSIIPHFNLSKIFEMKIEKDFLVFYKVKTKARKVPKREDCMSYMYE